MSSLSGKTRGKCELGMFCAGLKKESTTPAVPANCLLTLTSQLRLEHPCTTSLQPARACRPNVLPKWGKLGFTLALVRLCQ